LVPIEVHCMEKNPGMILYE